MTAPTASTVSVFDSSGSAKSMDVIADGANSNALAGVHCLVDGALNAVTKATVKAASTPSIATDTALVVAVRDNAKATYVTGANLFTLPATPTDVVEIKGSANTTVRIRKITVSGNATTVAQWPLKLIRRVAAITGGTPVTPVITALDSSDAAATAVVSHFTALGTLKAANPTSSVGFCRDLTLTAPASAAAPITFDFTTKNVVLRGAADCLVLNLGGGALVAGEKLSYEVELSEDAS